MTNSEFIANITPLAIQSMQRSKVPASLIIAQGALESAWGNSGLTVRANNLFGIKGAGPAGSITAQTTEYENGKAVKENAVFRAYHNWSESISDHSEILVNGVSWNRNLYSKVLGASGKTAALEIANAGYATDPNYAQKLISIMDRYNLYQYDNPLEEDDEMSAEDKKKLVDLEAELQELHSLVAGLVSSKDTLKTGLQEQGQALITLGEHMTVMEDRVSMSIPSWAEPAVKAAMSAGLLDTPAGGSYDFYRILTVLSRAGLLKKAKEG